MTGFVCIENPPLDKALTFFKLCDGIEKIKKAERIKIAQRMLSSGKFTYDEIAYFTNLTLEEIKALTNNQSFVLN